jgi:hypothetical protein
MAKQISQTHQGRWLRPQQKSECSLQSDPVSLYELKAWQSGGVHVRSPAAIDKRFVEYLLELSEGVTGRIIEVLRRAALEGIADKTQRVSLVQLQVVGAKVPSVVGQRA